MVKSTISLIAVLILGLVSSWLIRLPSYAQSKITSGQSSNNSVSKEEAEEENPPIAIYETGKAENVNTSNATNQEKARRMGKNKKYDKSNAVEELPPPITVSPRSADWTASVPVIPVAQSSIVVIGDVTKAEAFLSNDKTGVYSEFSISVADILKNDARTPIYQGQVLIAERAGGAVQFPSGQVQRVKVFLGQRMPMIGHRYIFFLKRNEAGDFSILTGYELRQNKIIALDHIQPFANYTGTDGDSFLNTVRQLLSQEANKEGQN